MEPKPNPTDSFLEKIETMQAASGYLAVAVVPLFRRRVGLRMTRGLFLYPVVLLMALLGFYADKTHALAWYALAVLLTGLWQNVNRWKELKRGDLTHTRGLGVSPLMAIPFAKFLPAKVAYWITDGDHVHRTLDPIGIFLIGLLIMQRDQMLGGWIMLSATALRIFEEFRHETTWNFLLDGVDAMLMGETQKAFMDRVRRGSAGPFTDPATGRQTTGVMEELGDRIAKRRAADAQAAQEAQERPGDQARPHPFTETMNRVKEAAGAVKEAAEAVSAVREAGSAPERETVIIDRTHTHTSDTLVVLKEQPAYIPFAVEPDAGILTHNGPVALEEPRPAQLAAPPEDDERDQAA